MSITHVGTFLRRPLHDVKLPNATFCEGPRTHGDEVLLLDRDAVLKIQIPEISSPFLIYKTLHKDHEDLN